MKKICFFICIVCVCALLLTLAACRKTDTAEDNLVPMSEVRLMNEHMLCWDPVEGARYYSLRVLFSDVDGYEIPVYDTQYLLKLYNEGTYTLSVRPVFADGYGAFSAPVSYVVAKEVEVTPVEVSEGKTVVLRGTGTYEDPILLYTKEELATLTTGTRSEEVNGETVTSQNFYRLMADIDLSEEEWKPIAANSKFEGLFDGNGHTIRGLTQTALYGTTNKRNGLFGTLSNATVINLKLEVQIRIGLVNDKFCLGGLAGYSVNSTVENCEVVGTITVDSPQTNDQSGYIGLLLGYSNGTSIRRTAVDGTIRATYSKVYAGGMTGITTAPESDILDNCLSTANVYATSSYSKGLAYAAGFTYISNKDSIANCVWLGEAKATPAVGTDATTGAYGEGMFVCSINSTTKTGGKRQCNIVLEDCFFAIDGLPYDTETYAEGLYATKDEWLAAVADRYCVGVADTQKRTSYVYAVDKDTRTDTAHYTWSDGGVSVGLDFDTVWTMGDNGPHLRADATRWYTVQFVADGKVVSTQRILRGRTARLPVYEGEEGHAVQWDFDAATPIEEDIIVHVVAQE